MAEAGKIKFAFTKVAKKTIVNPPPPEPVKKVDRIQFIDSLEDNSFNVINETKEEKTPLVIPMSTASSLNKRMVIAIQSRKRNQDIKSIITADTGADVESVPAGEQSTNENTSFSTEETQDKSDLRLPNKSDEVQGTVSEIPVLDEKEKLIKITESQQHDVAESCGTNCSTVDVSSKDSNSNSSAVQEKAVCILATENNNTKSNGEEKDPTSLRKGTVQDVSVKSDSNDKDSTITEKSNIPETLEEMAAREILEDVQKFNEEKQKRVDAGLVISLEKATQLDQESTLQDYENIPVSDFGLAILRGMGWDPKKGIGKDGKVIKMDTPTLRPKGMGLGADKVIVPQKTTSRDINKDLVLKTSSKVRVTYGKFKNLYGTVVGFDDDSSRITVKLSVGNETIELNECFLQLVNTEEFNKYSKVLNINTYSRYKDSEENPLKPAAPAEEPPEPNKYNGGTKEDSDVEVLAPPSKSPLYISSESELERSKDKKSSKKSKKYESDKSNSKDKQSRRSRSSSRRRKTDSKRDDSSSDERDQKFRKSSRRRSRSVSEERTRRKNPDGNKHPSRRNDSSSDEGNQKFSKSSYRRSRSVSKERSRRKKDYTDSSDENRRIYKRRTEPKIRDLSSDEKRKSRHYSSSEERRRKGRLQRNTSPFDRRKPRRSISRSSGRRRKDRSRSSSFEERKKTLSIRSKSYSRERSRKRKVSSNNSSSDDNRKLKRNSRSKQRRRSRSNSSSYDRRSSKKVTKRKSQEKTSGRKKGYSDSSSSEEDRHSSRRRNLSKEKSRKKKSKYSSSDESSGDRKRSYSNSEKRRKGRSSSSSDTKERRKKSKPSRGRKGTESSDSDKNSRSSYRYKKRTSK